MYAILLFVSQKKNMKTFSISCVDYNQTLHNFDKPQPYSWDFSADEVGSDYTLANSVMIGM